MGSPYQPIEVLTAVVYGARRGRRFQNLLGAS